MDKQEAEFVPTQVIQPLLRLPYCVYVAGLKLYIHGAFCKRDTILTREQAAIEKLKREQPNWTPLNALNLLGAGVECAPSTTAVGRWIVT